MALISTLRVRGRASVFSTGSAPLHLCATECIMRSIQLSVNCTQMHTPMAKTTPKTSAISIRVSDQVKDAVEKAAADDSRSVASFVEKLLAAHLKEKGYLQALADGPKRRK
jgi:hypothetical protein